MSGHGHCSLNGHCHTGLELVAIPSLVLQPVDGAGVLMLLNLSRPAAVHDTVLVFARDQPRERTSNRGDKPAAMLWFGVFLYLWTPRAVK